MLYSQQIKPISYFKDNSAKVIAEIKQTREPLIITQNGEATCVVQDIHSWEQTQQTIALLKILALGRQQVERGECSSAQSVFTELDEDMDGIVGVNGTPEYVINPGSPITLKQTSRN